jgi:hypothetical protein
MANMYINAMTALWNNVGTLYSAIKMNVTDSGSSDSPASKLIDLQVGSVTKFNADKNGNVYAAGDVMALGDLTVGGRCAIDQRHHAARLEQQSVVGPVARRRGQLGASRIGQRRCHPACNRQADGAGRRPVGRDTRHRNRRWYLQW